jgi:fatty-acyl-CoA synthase
MARSGLGYLTVGSFLTTAAGRYGAQEAIYCTATGRRFNYAQLNARCNQLANGLARLGLKKGDCVAFLSTNRAEVAEIYFAIAKAGFIGMPLNYRLAQMEMLALMEEVDAAALIYERSYAPAAPVAEAAAKRLRLKAQVGLGESTAGGAGPGLDYEALLAGHSAAEPAVEIYDDDPYYYNLTSGTTGMPKCYVISHYNNATFFNMSHALDLTRSDVVLTVFPMYGRVGFAWLAFSVMYGIRNVLMNFDPDRSLALIESEGVTISNLVPTMAAMMLASPRLAQTDLRSLRALVFAGSLLPAPIREGTVQRLCPDIYEYYGMQETATLVVSTPEDRKHKPDSVGRPVLFAQVRVVDSDARDLPVGETGAIIGRSPGAVTAYFKNPEKTAETFRDGWLHTGDLGRLDEDGFLYINGRLKDMIITGGQTVHAGEVEEAILRVPGILECAVVGLSDPLWGEVVTAVVVAEPGAAIDDATVIATCRQTLAGFKTPKRVIVHPEALPRTPTGKVRKFVLVEQYGDPS